MTPAETQRAVNLLVLNTLQKGGWTLTRDNEDGGSLVLEGDGIRIVGGFHAYDIKALKARDEAILAAAEAEALPVGDPADIPDCGDHEPLAVESIPLVEHIVASSKAVDDSHTEGLVAGKEPIGWVAERYVDGSVEWWNDESWVDSLSDAAIFTDDERKDMDDANWVQVYAHETDGNFTTEPCEGIDTCQDCLDVRKSAGENLADDPMDGHKDAE